MKITPLVTRTEFEPVTFGFNGFVQKMPKVDTLVDTLGKKERATETVTL